MNELGNPFLYNCWYAAAWTHEFDDTDKIGRTFLDKPVVIYRSDSGRFVALDNRCCHRGAPLSMGRVEGDCIRCMYHGMKYDAGGICVEIPGQDNIGANHRVARYPLHERAGLLWIWMGAPEIADPADVPDYAPLTDPAWRGFEKGAYLHYDANWLLIVDNLADFSHLAFVHTNTLGGSEDYAFVTHPEVERLDDGFRVVRWSRRADPAPYHLKVNPDALEKVDRCNDVQIQVPGRFYMSTLVAPVGWNPEADGDAQVKQYRNCQFMTPETRRTTHFFWNYLHNYRTDDPSISVSLQESLLEGFFEDKVIIEAQQQLLESPEHFQPRGMAGDQALTHFRRVYNTRLKSEREAFDFHETQTGNSLI